MAKYKIIPSSRTIVQSPISIGHKAEKGVEAIEFDLTAWVETYGSGTLTVIMRRWGDAIPYPIALEIDENNKATWTLSDIDTAKAGMAYAQLSYIVGDTVVKKSDIYTFRVMDSLTGEGEPPEAYESWLENLTHLAAEAMAEVLDIEGIVTDKTLTVDGGIADGKATGDALALKADKATTYTKTEVDGLIEDVTVETDTTLEVSGAAADAKTVGDELSEINESLDDVKADFNYYLQTIESYTNSPIIARGDATTTSAWGAETIFSNLSMNAKTVYKFNIHYYKTVSNSGYLRVYSSDNTKLIETQIGNGVSEAEIIYNNSIDRTGVYATISFSASNIRAYAEFSTYNVSFDDVKRRAIPVTYYHKYVSLNNSTTNVDSPFTSTNFNCSVVPCSFGDRFTINATGGTGARAWGFVASDGTVLIASAENAVCSDVVVIAPENSAYLVIHDSTDSLSYYGADSVDDVSSVSFISDNIPIFKTGYNITLAGEYVESSHNQVFNESTFYKFDDVPQISFSAGFTGGIFIRLYDRELNCLGNGGRSQATSGSIFIKKSMNSNLTADAWYMKIGSTWANYDPTKVTVSHATLGKVISGEKKTNILDTQNLNYIGVVSPIGTRANSYINETAQHKYFTILFGTDFHGDLDRMNEMKKLAGQGHGKAHYSMFDLAVNGGDTRHYSLADPQNGIRNGVALGGVNWVNDALADYPIPLINVIGNHDPGFSTSIDCLTDAECHDLFLANTVLANINKSPYGFYDNDTYKIRVIALYNYDSGIIEIAETASLSTLPAKRGYGCMYSQTQLDWLASTLNSVPEDYKVIILSHNAPLYREGSVEAFSDFTDANFAINTWKRQSYAVQGYRNSDGGGMGVIADIVQAYINKTTIDETYSYVGNEYWSQDLAYWSDVTADYDFTEAEGSFAFYLCGHVHKNVAIKCTMTGYTTQKLIAADTGSMENYQRGSSLSICRNIDTQSENCLLAVSLNTDNNSIGLVSIGANVDANGNNKNMYVIQL